MTTNQTSLNTGVRTVLHLSPAVCSAAVIAAQRHGLSLQEWLDHHVVNSDLKLIQWGCGPFLGLVYVVNPKLSRYSIGLR